MKKSKIKVLNLYNEAALEKAYSAGATEQNAKEIAGKMRLVDVAEYIAERKETRHGK